MRLVRTGYKRSLTVVITKYIGAAVAPGYPKPYPTATDLSNGYFTYLGVNYTIPSPEELSLMEQSAYDNLVFRFKQYVALQEDGLSFTNDFSNTNQEFDPVECEPGLITTTTTEQETTTTTGIPVTTTTTEGATTTTTDLPTTTTTVSP